MKAIEILHENGHTHNDLKLENLMLKDSISSNKNDNNVVLIDYGYAARFEDKNGKHITQHEIEDFRGNILFASVSQLEFQSNSRKSDLLSICYLLIFMLNDLEMPLQPPETGNEALSEVFEAQIKYKKGTLYYLLIIFLTF